ncbi:hypothetical protein VDGE_20994 [Verticillium dahliae]|uniref:Uncharacterized protein n=1 Tax=Verticillium dahliae TaxID=27337 RepID=A0A444RSJ1_VERDA|nr:hypothetical protein VDGE_20994 [Verticillium dahliae]
MSSSRGKTVACTWPSFVLTWLRQAARPADLPRRNWEEYIAGIGMIQANEKRRQNGLPLLEHGIILTGLHESSSDPRPHITLAAATKSMRKHHQHVVVHSRLSSSRFEDAEFVGSEEFPDNVRKDDERLRNSYASPIQTRASLIIKDSESVPVGCIVTSGRVQWYFLNDEQELVYLEEDNFYRAGQGGSQHLRASSVLNHDHPILNPQTWKELWRS